jgi:purine-cytosine permease-like protein
MARKLSALASRMDRLYEYDREPVAPEKLQSGASFAGLFAGEHVAATEFVIGAFFVLHGVRAVDLITGLLLGNLLAVLSWTFVCAPIAVRTRLTLYWYLRRIAGPGLTLVYNVLNALMYCILAGAMISVSSTAIGLLIGIPTPALTDVFPASVSWALLTFFLGCVFTVLAILGFEKLSKFAGVCSPWLFAVFVAAALATLARLGVRTDLSNLWEVLSTRVWNGVPEAGQEQFSFWHVAFFAWFANLAMHISLSDMALFRYAKHWSYGLFTAVGVYPGHFLAWICSGIMVAGVNRAMDPGLMAWEAAGLAGIVAVVVAGWTTANPTLYRAGLALQSVTPNWPRWKITLAAGLVTSVLACFPVFFMKLLDYVALYGLSLMPIGAVVFAEHWILPRLGVEPYRAERTGAEFNWNALIVWIGTLAACWFMPFHLFFRWLPGYFLALLAYTLLEAAAARRGVREAAAARMVRS